ncbi:MAG: YihY/virulence factor BrkB family protein [Armatimonadota bacterium]
MSRLKAMFQGAVRRNVEDFDRALHKDDGEGTAGKGSESDRPDDTPRAGSLPVSAPGSDVQHDASLSHVHGPIGYLKELFKRFSGDYCPAWAASLSFFSILSIPPVLLCGLAVLGFVIQDPAEATAQIQRILANVLPGGGDSARAQAADIIAQLNVEQSVTTLQQQRGIAGIIGVLSLFWAALQIFVNASTPMNAAFRTKESRGFIKLRLTALGLLFGAGFLFLLALTPTIATQFVGNMKILGLGPFKETVLPLIAVVFTLIGIAINAAMFTVIYRFLPSPSAKVTWKAAAISGAIVALLWEAAKQAFAFYTSRYANYDKVYGTLGGIVGLVFWIYYTSMILLLGAEIANLYGDAQRAKRHVPAK